MTTPSGGHERKAPSDIPESPLAAEFMTNSFKSDPNLEERYEDRLYGSNGLANKLFEIYEDHRRMFYRPEYESVLIKVFPMPLSAEDEDRLLIMDENGVVFNNALAGLDVHIIRRWDESTEPQTDGELIPTITGIWIIDHQYSASFGLFSPNPGQERPVALVWEKRAGQPKLEHRYKPGLGALEFMADNLQVLIDSEKPV
jgi:hypothetical protein